MLRAIYWMLPYWGRHTSCTCHVCFFTPHLLPAWGTNCIHSSLTEQIPLAEAKLQLRARSPAGSHVAQQLEPGRHNSLFSISQRRTIHCKCNLWKGTFYKLSFSITQVFLFSPFSTGLIGTFWSKLTFTWQDMFGVGGTPAGTPAPLWNCPLQPFFALSKEHPLWYHQSTGSTSPTTPRHFVEAQVVKLDDSMSVQQKRNNIFSRISKMNSMSQISPKIQIFMKLISSAPELPVFQLAAH